MRVIADAILGYLQAHPQACDTAEGIARWWIADARAERRRIEAALEVLCSQGLLERRTAAGGCMRYALRHAAPGSAA